MNGFDVFLLALAGVLGLVGLVKGLVRIVVGIAALVAAFLLSARFHGGLAAALAAWIDAPEPVLRLVAYGALFLGTMLVGTLVAFLTRKLLRAAMLGWADRLAGAVFGLLSALLAAALLVLPLVAYSGTGERVLRDSVLAPYVLLVSDAANHLVSPDLAERYPERVDELRRLWFERLNEPSEAVMRLRPAGLRVA